MLEINDKMCQFLGNNNITIIKVERVTPKQAILENGDKIPRVPNNGKNYDVIGNRYTCYVKADEALLKRFEEQQEMRKLRAWLKESKFSLSDLRKMHSAVQ
jgi:hypothetical protein